MSDITRRMMDAEAEANKDIAAKNYQHTASYAKLTGADALNLSSSGASGKSLHEQLIKRAHIKDNMAANSYKDSMLGTNSFRRAEFNEGDEKTRKKFLAKRHASKTSSGHDRTVDEKQIRGYQKPSDRVDMGKQDSTPHDKTSMRDSIVPTTRPAHKFSEPTKLRYNPYS
jgi:hypothetical protein